MSRSKSHFSPGTRNPFVYFIQGRITKVIKIGITSNIYQRLSSFKCDSADEVDVLACIPLDSPLQSTAIERYLHKRFDQFRHHGEWYSPVPELCDYITGLANKRGIDVYQEALLWQQQNKPVFNKKYYSKFSEKELLDTVWNDYVSGSSLQQIAANHGVSVATAYNIGSA